MSEFKTLKKKLNDLKKEYLKAGKQAFGEESKSLFEKHPKMKEFSWKQYTDYFNDGEPCTFSAMTDYPEINGEPEWGPDSDMSEEEFGTAASCVSAFLGQFDNEVLEHLFGDHCRVRVTPTKCKVESYTDHN